MKLCTAMMFDGDAERLLDALRARKDPRFSGYRRNSVEELERFFVTQGHLDDRPILDEAQLLARAIATPAANQLSPGIAAELLHQWWGLSQHASGA